MALDNSNNWVRVFEGNFYMAQIGPHRGQIEPVWLPLTQHTLRIRVNSQEAPASWTYAGQLVQVLGVGEEEMETTPIKVPLNRNFLVIFPQLTSAYRLKFISATWHKQIQIFVDVYNP